MEREEIIEKLTIMLLYLTSWRELTSRRPSPLRAWKGYNFDVLNDLAEKGYISGSRRAKSVYIEDKCIEEAKELLKEYFDFEEET